MARFPVERRLRRVAAELGRARDDLLVANDQIGALAEDGSGADGERHVQALNRSRESLLARIADLERARDELLDRLPAR